MTNKSAYQQGIHNAVNVCMNISEQDRVLITSDDVSRHIGQSLAEESKKLGAEVKRIKLEDYGQRPLTDVPEKMVTDSAAFEPTVTFFTASGQKGEVKMRMGSTLRLHQEFERKGLPQPRRAHMIGITPALIEEGMIADYTQIHQLTMDVLKRLEATETIQVTSTKGSDLTASFNPDYRWVPCHGLYHQPGEGGNLPEGEVFTCPDTLNGIIVADVLGDFFSSKYGVLEHPVQFTIAAGIVKDISCENKRLETELWDYLNSTANGTRVGEFAVGTNTAVKNLSGNLLQDEKIPGIHVAFGNPIGDQTGADWTSDVHIDVIPTDCTIKTDGQLLLMGSEFHL